MASRSSSILRKSAPRRAASAAKPRAAKAKSSSKTASKTATTKAKSKAVPTSGIGKLPVQLMQALPYILTCVLLAGFIGKAIPPRAGGVPYVKER